MDGERGTDPVAAELLALMACGAGAGLDDAGFDALARRVFAAQFVACAPFRAFCERRGRTPATVAHWSEIPAVPTDAFKEVTLVSDAGPFARVFETSGTTRERTGRHPLTAYGLALYRASMLPTFRRFLLPDERSDLVPLVLGPPADEAPASSLAFMIDGVCEAFGAEAPRHFLGARGWDEQGLAASLAAAERAGRPVMLLGTSLAFLDLAERWAGGPRFRLPPGSRAMETGGAKGRRATADPAALRGRVGEAFGIPDAHVVNEYGMTEACSQFYDATMLGLPRAKHGPPWARALVCDPETLAPAAPGTLGVLRLVDLANRYSVSFLQTADLAIAEDGVPGAAPFRLEGRARGADARGCSLAAEEWARAVGGARP